MLCCVSKKALTGVGFGPSYNHYPKSPPAVMLNKVERVERIEAPLKEDEPAILLPCAICARTFTPQSLEKHVKICERAAAKKRKPFDSAKQRIQGTDLAEFLPKQEKEKKPRHYYEEKSTEPTSSWKQSHDDFLRVIRAARDNLSETPIEKQTSNAASTRGPTRANEKGVCPTCNRQFGVKAYDRHVAWCKERATRLPISQATNVAKERLEARMKYRAPVLKNRRATNREKYSPGSTMSLNQTSKVSLPPPSNLRSKETTSAPNCSRPTDVLVKQKSPVIRSRQQQSALGRRKSSAADQTNRPIEDCDSGSPSIRVLRPASPLNHAPHFPDFSTKPEEDKYTAEIKRVVLKTPSKKCAAKPKVNTLEKSDYQIATKGYKNLPRRSNIVLTRSQGNPKLNDISVNHKIPSMEIQSCTIYKDDTFGSCEQITQRRSQVKIDIAENNAICRDLQATNFETSLDENIGRLFTSQRKITQCNEVKETIHTRKKLSSLQTDVGKRNGMIDASNEIRWNPLQYSPRVDIHLTNTHSYPACNKNPDKSNYHMIFLEKNISVNNTFVAKHDNTEVNDYVCSLDGIIKSKPNTIKILKERENNNMFVSKERKVSKAELKRRDEGELKLEDRFEGRSLPTLERVSVSPASCIIECFQKNDNNYQQTLLDENPQKDERSVKKSRVQKTVVSEKKHNNINSLTKSGQGLSRDHCKQKSKRWPNEKNFTVGNTYVTDSELKIFETSSINMNSEVIAMLQTGKDKKKPLLGIDSKLWTKNVTLGKSVREYNNLITVGAVNESNLKSSDKKYFVIDVRSAEINVPIRRKNPFFTSQSQMCAFVKWCTHELHTKDIECILKMFRQRMVLNELHNASPRSADKESTDDRFKVISLQEQRSKDYSISHNKKTFLKSFVERFVDYTLLSIISESIHSKLSKNLRHVEGKINYTVAGLKITDKKKEKSELGDVCINNSSLFLVNNTMKRERNKTALRYLKKFILKNYFFHYIYNDRAGANNRQLCSEDPEKSNNSSCQREIYILDFMRNFLFEFLLMINVNQFVKFNVNIQFNFIEDNNPENRKTKTIFGGNFDISPVINLNRENNTKEVASKRLRRTAATNGQQLRQICNEKADKDNSNSWNDNYRDPILEKNHYSLSQNARLNNLKNAFSNNMKNEEDRFTDLFEGNEHFHGVHGCSVKTSENNNFLYENKVPCVRMNKSKRIMSSIKKSDTIIPTKTCEINKHNLNQHFVYGSVLKEEWPINLKEVKCPRFIKTTTTRLQKNLYETRWSAPNIKSSESNKAFHASNAINDISILPVDLNSSEMRKKLRHSMSLLRSNTNTLISSTEAIGVTNRKGNRTLGNFYESETIQEIVVSENRIIGFGTLPKIKGDSQVAAGHEHSSKIGNSACSKKTSMFLKKRLISFDPLHRESIDHFKKNFQLPILPPVRCNTVVKKASGTRKDYDPFLLAEQQMNELLSDTSGSTTDGPTTSKTCKSLFPLSHSSAFVKYPSQEVTTPATTTTITSTTNARTSVIAPPTEFDDLISDFSSDSTETNSLSRETFLKDLKEFKGLQEFDKIYEEVKNECKSRSPTKELSRRVIIDKSKVLGNEVVEDPSRGSRSFVGSAERARKILDKVSPKVVRPTAVNRTDSIRASSAPKPSTNRKITNTAISNTSNTFAGRFNETQSYRNPNLNNENNNDVSLSASNLSLSSIMSSEIDIKRSNSVFDDLISSFEDNISSFPSSEFHVKNDSLSMSSPVHGSRSTHNGQVSDEEFSSPDSYKRQDHGKFSADSAYGSLNRKYSNHVRSTTDIGGHVDEEATNKINNRRASDSSEVAKCKMSNFCHECGSKFPKTAKYCCECGMKRLIL